MPSICFPCYRPAAIRMGIAWFNKCGQTALKRKLNVLEQRFPPILSYCPSDTAKKTLITSDAHDYCIRPANIQNEFYLHKTEGQTVLKESSTYVFYIAGTKILLI